MPAQFLHIGNFGRAPKRGEPSWSSIDGVTSEGMRAPGASKHVALPKHPRVYFGEDAAVAAKMARANANLAVDAAGKNLRKDGIALYAGVVSYPLSWAAIDMDGEAHLKMHNWCRATTEWLSKTFGPHLISVIVHVDETYPHLHFFVVPPLTPDNRIDHGAAHPAHKAKRLAVERGLAEGASLKVARQTGDRAYVEGMRALQDDFHRRVSKRFGHDRYAERRTRVSRIEKTAEIRAEALQREVFKRAKVDAIRVENEAYDRGLAKAERELTTASRRATDAQRSLDVERKRSDELAAEVEALRARVAELSIERGLSNP
jgi:hypothetical protein